MELAPAVISFRAIGIQGQRFMVILKGSRKHFFLSISIPAVGIRVGIFRIEFYSFIEIENSFIKIPFSQAGRSPVVIGIYMSGVQLDGFIIILNRPIKIFSGNIDIAAIIVSVFVQR